MPGLFFLFFIVVVVLIIISFHAEKKRRERIRLFAVQRGYRFFPGKDRDFARTFQEFRCLQQGSSRFAQYRMDGEWNGMNMRICEYHYQVTHGSGKNRSTHHYWSTLLMLQPDFYLKPLTIRREGVFDKMKGAFGWDDIDFSSAEFSRNFYVTSPDRDWAFAVVQPRTMDLLMQKGGEYEFHMQQGWLMVRMKQRMDLNRIDPMAKVGSELLALIPDFCKEQ